MGKLRFDLPPSPAWDEKSCDGLNHGEKHSAFGVTMMVFSIYLVKLARDLKHEFSAQKLAFRFRDIPENFRDIQVGEIL